MELPIQITITTWLGLLRVGLILFLLMAVPAWLAYRQGCRKAPLYQAALGHIPLGVALFEANRQPFFQNDLAAPLLKQFPADIIERAKQAGGQGQPYATAVQEPQGGWINLQAWPLGNQKPGVLLLLRAIAQEQDQPQSAKEYSRKFIKMISHELFTPIGTIQMHLENAVESHNLTAGEYREIIQKTWQEMERLMRLVANLKAWLHLELLPPLPRRRIKITDLAKSVAEFLQPQAEARRITLAVVEPERSLPLTMVEEDAWRQLFVNLIDNGIKYGKPGGTVRIEARQTIAGLRILVADDGPGIPPDDVPHLFEELFRGTARGDTKGSGLGLYIVSQVVRQHGGKIHCESELGHGTTFNIDLPLSG